MMPPTCAYNYFILLILFCHRIGRNCKLPSGYIEIIIFISKNTNQEVAMESFQPKLVLISFTCLNILCLNIEMPVRGPFHSARYLPAGHLFFFFFFPRFIGKKMPGFFLQAYLDNDLLFKK